MLFEVCWVADHCRNCFEDESLTLIPFFYRDAYENTKVIDSRADVV